MAEERAIGDALQHTREDCETTAFVGGRHEPVDHAEGGRQQDRKQDAADDHDRTNGSSRPAVAVNARKNQQTDYPGRRSRTGLCEQHGPPAQDDAEHPDPALREEPFDETEERVAARDFAQRETFRNTARLASIPKAAKVA